MQLAQDANIDVTGMAPTTTNGRVGVSHEDASPAAAPALEDFSNLSQGSVVTTPRDLKGLKIYPDVIRELFEMSVSRCMRTLTRCA